MSVRGRFAKNLRCLAHLAPHRLYHYHLNIIGDIATWVSDVEARLYLFLLFILLTSDFCVVRSPMPSQFANLLHSSFSVLKVKSNLSNLSGVKITVVPKEATYSLLL